MLLLLLLPLVRFLHLLHLMHLHLAVGCRVDIELLAMPQVIVGDNGLVGERLRSIPYGDAVSMMELVLSILTFQLLQLLRRLLRQERNFMASHLDNNVE